MRKRSVGLLVALLMGIGVAFAAQQQGKTGQTSQTGQASQMGQGKPTIDEQVARMKVNLNLTDQQAAQVKELLEKQKQEAQTWRSNNPNPSQEELKTHRQQMWRQIDEGLKKILTPEQYKKHQETMQRGMKHGPQGPPQH
jgi:Spy/CpxP family protein refolding chaperone